MQREKKRRIYWRTTLVKRPTPLHHQNKTETPTNQDRHPSEPQNVVRNRNVNPQSQALNPGDMTSVAAVVTGAATSNQQQQQPSFTTTPAPRIQLLHPRSPHVFPGQHGGPAQTILSSLVSLTGKRYSIPRPSGGGAGSKYVWDG